MGGRWWLLFRSLAVPTVLFFAPVLVDQDLRRLSYLLSVKGAVAELALEISAVLLLEALCATFLALILLAGHAFKLWDDRADANCAGFIAFASAILCALALLFPLNGIIGPLSSAGLQAALILAAIALPTFFGWQRAFALICVNVGGYSGTPPGPRASWFAVLPLRVRLVRGCNATALFGHRASGRMMT